MAPDLALLLGISARAVRDDPGAAKQRFHEEAVKGAPVCPGCGKPVRHRTLTAEQCADRQMSEADLQKRVQYRAKKHGWKIAHAGRGIVGYREDESPIIVTPMAEGWPDLSCFKAGHRPVFLELKREQGTVEPEQWEWLWLLNECGARAVVIRPSDLRNGTVEQIFREGSPLDG